MTSNLLYIGVDFHPHQQTVAWCDTRTGETQTLTLHYDLEKVRKFYQSLEPAIVGIEATCKAVWFENLLAETDHQLWVGNPVLIRRRATSRHKSDRRDAELILNLLLKGEFPVIWRRLRQNNRILDVLKLRSSFVKQRTQTSNRLQALAKNFGLPRGQIKSKYYQSWLRQFELDDSSQLQRRQLFGLVEKLDEQIAELDNWLQTASETDQRVQLLLTQKGVGRLTALAVVNTIGDISRFDRPTKQIPAYLGLEPSSKTNCPSYSSLCSSIHCKARLNFSFFLSSSAFFASVSVCSF